jgi:spermidine synthase
MERLSLTSLVFGFFFLSGAFALVYEVSWVRAMTLLFGSTSLAASTVLSVFMGGLALGAWLSGRRADRLGAPLTTYGVIEVALSLYALLTPWLFRWVLPVFEWFGGSVSDAVLPISLFRFAVVAVLLLPPTALMGATLPILSRFYAQRRSDPGRGAGLLYGLNTLGAFAGTVAAGLLLLPTLGLHLSIVTAALANLALGTTAFLLGRSAESSRVAPARTPSGTWTEPVEDSGISFPPILFAVALTGFAAMVSEVAWTRILVLALGASVYAFTVMLATFLAGLGLGAAGVAKFLRADPVHARRVFYGLALLAALTLCVSSAASQQMPELFRSLFWSLGLPKAPGWIVPVQFAIAAALMVVPAFVMGGLFPAALRIVVRDAERVGKGVGGVYAWNTLGTILGSFAAGFALIPWLGIRGALLVAASAQCASALIVSLGGKREPRSALGVALAAGAIPLMVWLTPPWHQQVMTSAMYDYAGRHDSVGVLGLERRLGQLQELLYYRDGLTATVTVSRDVVSEKRDLYIATNGKIDGSSHFDMPTQRLLAHVPILFHPAPREVAVIGMGTGSTAGSAALHDAVERVTVVEIEAAMVEGAVHFREHNHAVHEDPKVDIRIADGRLFLRLHPASFDVITSEPSNPWLAGSSDLFTTEFFRLSARALREGGLFCQWVQLYAIAPDNLRTIVRTFADVFPHVYLVSSILETDVLLLGSLDPLPLDVERARLRMQDAVIGTDLADPRVGVESVHQLAARIRMGPSEIRSFVGSGPLHTDDLPIIAYRAPKDLYRETRKANADLLARSARGVSPYVVGLPPSRDARLAFFSDLAAAYRAILPGGSESLVSRQIAARLRSDSEPRR